MRLVGTAAAAVAVAGSLLLGSCAGDAEPSASAPGTSPLTSPTITTKPSPAASTPAASAPVRYLTPAVMLGSVIRTPDGQLRTGIDRPATFVQTQGGFVVQDTAGTTYTVEGRPGEPTVREIGTAEASRGLELLVDVEGRWVAWLERSSGGWIAEVYDVRAGRRAPDVPLAGRARPEVEFVRGAIRAVSAAEQADGLLSPTGAWSLLIGESVTVRDNATGTEVLSDVASGSLDPVWTGPTTFTVVSPSAPLISPPDSEVFHVDECDVTTGACDNVIQVATGQALSVVGLPVTARYQRG